MAAENGRLRASDAERERIIEALRRHTADGRLTLEEFEERVGEALAATTRDDLGPVLRDLPALPPDRADRPRVTAPRTGWATAGAARAVLGAVAVVAVVTLLVTSGGGMWWIVFPLMGVFGGCGRGARSCTSGRTRHAGDDRYRNRAPDVDREFIRV
jgi:hypothetical protein